MVQCLIDGGGREGVMGSGRGEVGERKGGRIMGWVTQQSRKE